MTKLFQDKRYRVWFALFLISFFGIALMIATTYIHGSVSRSYKMETTILWIYFTYLSNLSAFIVSVLVITNKININNKHLQRGKTLMTVNLTVTCLIFWAILSWNLGKYNALQIVSTLCVHLVTPSFAIFTYFYEGKNSVLTEKSKPLHTMILNTIFPVLWLIIAITFYYTMGADKDAAIYGFLDFNNANLFMSVGIIVAIAVMYPGLTYLYSKIYNK